MGKPKWTFWSAKLRQIHIYKEWTSGDQLGERREVEQDRDRKLRGTNYYVQAK